MTRQDIRWLRRRYGGNIAPVVIINGLILCSILYRISHFGLSEISGSGIIKLIFMAIFINIIPLLILYDVWGYRIGYNDLIIRVRPLVSSGPYMEMGFADVETVDLKARTDLLSGKNEKFHPSCIVLYRKGWDGGEIFALDPRRTNLKQFKDLVRLIHDRCPGTFTENALRYLNGPNLCTPCEDPQGEFIW